MPASVRIHTLEAAPPNAADLRTLLTTLLATDPDEANIVKQERESAVYLTPPIRLPGQPEPVRLIVKSRSLTTLRTRLQHAVGLSRAARQMRGSRLLRAAALPAAPCLATATRITASQRLDVLVMELVPGTSLLHHLASSELTIPQQLVLADRMGSLVADLAHANLFNRDMKPSNVIIAPDHTPVIIDTVAIRTIRGGRARNTARVRMLASLLIEPIGCNVRPRGTLIYRVLRAECQTTLARTLGRAPDPSLHTRRVLKALIRTTAKRVHKLLSTRGPFEPMVNPLAKPSSHEVPATHG